MRKLRVAWFTTFTGELLGVVIREIEGQPTKAWIGCSPEPGRLTDSQDAELIMRCGAKLDIVAAEAVMKAHGDSVVTIEQKS